MKQEVFEAVNKCVVSEYGNPVTMQNLVIDSNLDSLGMTLLLLQLDAKFCIFKDKPEDVSEFDYLSITTLTVRDLVNRCVLSSTQASTEPKNVMATLP